VVVCLQVDSSLVAGTQLFCISWYTVTCVLAGVVLVGVYDGFVYIDTNFVLVGGELCIGKYTVVLFWLVYSCIGRLQLFVLAGT